MGPECASIYKRLADLIAQKWNERYAAVIDHIRTGLRFAKVLLLLYIAIRVLLLLYSNKSTYMAIRVLFPLIYQGEKREK
jgi:hypothetical protein